MSDELHLSLGKNVAKKRVTAKTAGPKASTKAQIFKQISLDTGLSKSEIQAVFDSLDSMIGENLGKGGPGVFTIPGLIKLKVVKKPATKARKGINPFTGEEMIFTAKAARNVVKVLPLAGLKALAGDPTTLPRPPRKSRE